jgi:hypothetical protein
MSNLPTSVLESSHDGLKIWCLHAIVLRPKVKTENIKLQKKKKKTNKVDIESGKKNTKLEST